jgi:hypothetical protein
MTSAYHGGRATRKSNRKMRGGALGASFPDSFETLPQDMQDLAGVGKLNAAFNQLPEFAGKYGMMGGRYSRKMRGGVADVSASAMILTPTEAAQAGLHPQWANENLVVPSYVSPDSVLPQKAGKRKSRKASRKAGRKATRKGRKASRKGRKDRK